MRRRNLLRSSIVLLLSTFFWAAAGFAAYQAQQLAQQLAQRLQSDAEFQRSIQPFLAANCYSCHNTRLMSGGLNLEAYTTAASVIQNRESWELALQKLRAGEMPPKGAPR